MCFFRLTSLLLVATTGIFNGLFGATQSDTLKQRSLYSFSIQAQAGTMNTAGALANRFVERTIAGSEVQGYHLYNMHYFREGKHRGQTIRVDAMLSWKKKLKHAGPLNFLEFGTGLGYMRVNGGYVSAEGKVNPNQTLVNTFSHIGAMDISGIQWNNRLMAHFRRFWRDFGGFAGLEVSMFYGQFGQHNKPTFEYFSSTLYDIRSSLYSLGMPVGIKYNASCELNLELFYQPTGAFMDTDVLHPGKWAFFQTLGFRVRYKLNTSPASTNNKRIDMFF